MRDHDNDADPSAAERSWIADRTNLPVGCNTLDDLPAPWSTGIGRQAAMERNWLLFLIADDGRPKPSKIPVTLTPKPNGPTAKAPIGIAVDQAARHDLLSVLAGCHAANEPDNLDWLNTRLAEWAEASGKEPLNVRGCAPGYLARPGSAMIALDFDNIREADGRHVARWVLPTIKASYVEFSISGRGLRCLIARRPGDENLPTSEKADVGYLANGKRGAVITMRQVNKHPILDSDVPRQVIADRWAAADAATAGARGAEEAAAGKAKAKGKTRAKGKAGKGAPVRAPKWFEALSEDDQQVCAASALAALPADYCDARDGWWRIACMLRAHEHLFPVFDTWSMQSPKYGGTEDIWASVAPGEVENEHLLTIGSLFVLAEEHGWDPSPWGGSEAATLPDLRDFKDVALRFLDAYVHEDGWTIAERQGEVFRWGGAHWTPLEHNEVTSDVRLWLEEQTTVVTVADPEGGDGVPMVVPVRPDKKLVAEVEAAIRARIRRTDGVVPEHIVVVRNGSLNMRTGKLHLHTPKLFNTVSIDATWRPEFEAMDAKALIGAIEGTAFGDFLESITGHEPEQKATLGEFWGLSLTTDTSEQKIIFILGTKRSGKGTMFWLMRRMQRGVVVSMTAKRLTGSMPLQPCIGKNVMQLPDMRLTPKISTADLAEMLLSISGEDGFNIARKFLVDWEGMLSLKIWLATNLLPQLEDPSGTLASRMLFVRLPVSFYDREDKGLKGKIAACADQVLAWSIGHWRGLKERGTFTTGPSHTALAAQMESRQSPLTPFLRQRVEFTGRSEDMIAKEEVYLAFRADAAEFGVTDFTRNALTRALARQVPPIVQGRAMAPKIGSLLRSKQRVYRGIRWRDGQTPTVEDIQDWADDFAEDGNDDDDRGQRGR